MGSDNFSSTLDLLKGYYVNLYVGEEIIKGKLMGVETDHLVLEDENKYVYYYSIDKIQAITKNTKQFKSEKITSDYMKTQSLIDLLSSLQNSWVSILCLNKQSFSGVLSIVDSDFATLINGEDRILVKISHIANILKGYRKEESKANNNQADNSEKKQDKKEEKNKKSAVAPVSAKENKKENKNEKNSPQREKVKKTEKEEVAATKVIVNEVEKEKKVWSEPIKNVADKPIVVAAPRVNQELKKVKTEIKQAAPAEPKKQKSEPVQHTVKREQEPLKKPTVYIQEKKNTVKETINEVKSIKVDSAPINRVTVKQTQELLSKVKKVKDSYETTQPLMKIDHAKKDHTENKTQEKPVAQEVGAFRFAGEPAQRDYDRRSIFSGWPSRKSSPRRF
jgi:chemotaxis protein histidine kinase CheA